MELRKLGRTDLTVSSVCLGTMQFGWRIDEKASVPVLDAFLERGGNFIDTADMYSNWAPGNPGGVAEQILGRWMKARGTRSRVVLATKVRCRMWEGADGEGLSRKHIARACEDSLRRLQTDVIDLYQTHWDDEATPQEETAEALDALVRAGKVRWLGCSNFSGKRLASALAAADARKQARYACVQPHYNYVKRDEYEGDVERLVANEGIGNIPYSPLAAGFLTGRYGRERVPKDTDRSDYTLEQYGNEEGWTRLERAEAFAKRHGLTMIQVAMAWLYARPTVTSPIIGANSVAQLEENLKAAEVRLTAAQADELG